MTRSNREASATNKDSMAPKDSVAAKENSASKDAVKESGPAPRDAVSLALEETAPPSKEPASGKEPASRKVSRPPVVSVRPPPVPVLRDALDRAQREVTSFQRSRWQVPGLKMKDPERMKAYSRLSARLTELEVMLPSVTSEQDVAAVASVLSRIQRKLGRELAWDIAEQLQLTLVRISPPARLSSLLESERTLVREHAAKKGDAALPYGNSIDWGRKFPVEELERLCADYKNGNPSKETREVSIARLVHLYEARIDAWRHLRAHTQLRSNYLQAVAVSLFGLLGALVVLVNLVLHFAAGNELLWMLLTTAMTGALGSVLTGVFKLRDEMMSIRQLRSFAPVLIALPVVGATAATVLFVVLHAGLLTIGGLEVDELNWAHHALFGFLAGFSETFFFGIVKKLAGQLDDSEPKPPSAPSQPTQSLPTTTLAAR
jgi:hypothetical protein